MSACELPTIAISSGDPAGIGPEVVVKALADEDLRRAARWIVVGDAWVLAAASASTPWAPDRVVHDERWLPRPPSVVVRNCGALDSTGFRLGQVSAACGAAALRYVEIATELCRCGLADALVTAPLSKEAVALTGRHFTGHTEYLAELCGGADSRMMLVNDRYHGTAFDIAGRDVADAEGMKTALRFAMRMVAQSLPAEPDQEAGN